jgi:hypothetical protein
MSAVTRLQRVAVLDRLHQVLAASSTDPELTIVQGPPRNPQQGKLIVVGSDVTGELSVAHLSAGRKSYDDRFDVECLCIAWDPGADSHQFSDLDCEQLAELVRDTVADRPRLEAVVGADGMDGVVSAVVGGLDGPNRWWNPEGVGTAMRLTINIHVRID